MQISPSRLLGSVVRLCKMIAPILDDIAAEFEATEDKSTDRQRSHPVPFRRARHSDPDEIKTAKSSPPKSAHWQKVSWTAFNEASIAWIAHRVPPEDSGGFFRTFDL